MSRFLAAFRAGGAPLRIAEPYGADNPENPENRRLRVPAGGFRDCRDCRDSEGQKSTGQGEGVAKEAMAARIAHHARWQAEAEAALAAHDDDLATERAVMAGHYAAPAVAHPYQTDDPDALRDGLLAGYAHRRTP